MPIPSQQTTLTVALIGNPNTGKSTLFSALVGIHQHVGNYPGVTVEKKTGWMDHAGSRYKLIDLPGLYSLAPRSRDEVVAVDLLLGRRQDSPPVDLVVCIADAGNLERNFYLLSQVLELGLPTVVQGSNYRIKYPSGSTWLEVPFESEAGGFTMELTFESR